MTTTDAAALTPEQIVERNLAVVDAHFHNENPEDIDKAIDLYGETIVWEVPARGVLLRDKAEVKEAYLKLFESYQVTKMIQVSRFGTGNSVVDDSIAEMTLVGDVENNVPGCPFPAGTEVSMRIVHIFELDDNGRITRENGYELWRRLDGPINDDIPADAVVIDF
ncbi:nuclear transport factor 2 family protein [Nocardioides sp. NPDC006273]|uniref:nuclear transport factor 2 family protein n=1 Tax=Nocardioides sp. NPDC006273 TaxID=3155598 RepID=UPI0033BB908A